MSCFFLFFIMHLYYLSPIYLLYFIYCFLFCPIPGFYRLILILSFIIYLFVSLSLILSCFPFSHILYLVGGKEERGRINPFSLLHFLLSSSSSSLDLYCILLSSPSPLPCSLIILLTSSSLIVFPYSLFLPNLVSYSSPSPSVFIESSYLPFLLTLSSYPLLSLASFIAFIHTPVLSSSVRV